MLLSQSNFPNWPAIKAGVGGYGKIYGITLTAYVAWGVVSTLLARLGIVGSFWYKRFCAIGLKLSLFLMSPKNLMLYICLCVVFTLSRQLSSADCRFTSGFVVI
jgi:hypothetical protein